jgi:hypothetical protein
MYVVVVGYDFYDTQLNSKANNDSILFWKGNQRLFESEVSCAKTSTLPFRKGKAAFG